MEKILDIISAKMQKAFADAGYDASFGRVTVSNRPICVNISATARWLPPSSTNAPPSRSQTP